MAPTSQAKQPWWDDGQKKHFVPLAPAVPVDPTINTWSRFGPTFEAYEYSGWIDESVSWKTDCYIGDWSPLLKVRVTGPEALSFFEYISTNHWPNFKPGQAKHAIFCQDNGCVVGDGLLLMLDKDDFLFTSGPGTVWVTYQFRSGRKKFNANLELVTDDWFLLQVQGPRSAQLLNEVTDRGVQDIKFMHYKELSVDGSKFLCLRQGVSGELGFELWGPAKDARKIYSYIVDVGKKHNIRQLGARAKMVNHVEAAFATPSADFIPAVHAPTDDKELINFRQFARDIGFDFDLYLSKASGSYGTDPVSYHFTPFDLNWGWLINFDHDFIGRDALAKLKDNPPYKLVTLVWSKEDVTDVFASLFRPDPFEYMEMPRSLLGEVNGSTVVMGGKEIGCAVSRCYSYWFKEMLSLGILSKDHATPGTAVEVRWGSEGYPQKTIRAIVQPAPYKEDKRRYSIRDLASRHEKTIHGHQLQSGMFNTRTRASPGYVNTPVQAPTPGTVADDQNESLQLLLAPCTGTSTQDNPPPFDSSELDAPVNPLGASFNVTSEAEAGLSNGISLDFFDPFIDKMFDHFVLPIDDDDQGQLLEPLGSTSSQYGYADQMESLDVWNGAPTSTPGRTNNQGMPTPRRKFSPRALRPTTTANKRSVTLTDDMRLHCLADLKSRLTFEQLGDFSLPATTSLQQYFNSYVESFHIHFPFLHLQTLNLETAPSPLILGICAIGALHRLERKVAASLHLTAERALTSIDFDRLQTSPTLLQDWARPRDSPSADPASLSLAQARLILVFFAAFSGEPQFIRQALVGCGHLSADFRLRMSAVRPGSTDLSLSQWRPWVEHESTKRCMVLGNLLLITYGISPGFTVLEETNIEMPAEDALWEAATASDWELLIQSKRPSSPIGIHEAAASLFGTNAQDTRPDTYGAWSPFAASVVMHHIAIAIWYLADGQQAVYGISENWRECHHSDAARIEMALSKCRDLLTESRTGNDGTWNEADGPLLFNAFAVLRVSYGRAFINVRSLDRSLLFKETSQDMLAILQRYFEAPQERDQFMTMAVGRALEGVAIPIRAGMLLMQKTAAFKWSVEHALAGWDAALLVTKWVHTVESMQISDAPIAPEEKQVLENVCHLLSQIDIECSRHRSLAAELARVWAGIYDDTWVWGIAPRIGWVLRELAKMYEGGASSAAA
ncbi:hypothetical protein FDECE_12346 [Fusarium decemcellulare]|nr:hypothetical protein FDECE_12346 [Fusarium decemcellulare]